ncbi:hypothetical protein ISN76_00145 [Dyella halodurans]|uniref:Uncharacterized protein n=1 Tax=Dyella halodurans TaxID=1920171 RepID=A0ABV9BY80_9GAMM|nr:hypothetical protein [Dyella halodurans]
MPFPLDRILMAYRPLYLRGLLMDGQYKLPARPTPETVVKQEGSSTEVVAERVAVAPHKPLHGAAT